MPNPQSRQTLGQLRTFIAGQLDSIGHPEWAARFSSSFTNANIAATLIEIQTLELETWAQYLQQWDEHWQSAQDDVWSGAAAAGLDDARVSGLLSDDDVRAKIVFKAMMKCASMLLMRHRYETR